MKGIGMRRVALCMWSCVVAIGGACHDSHGANAGTSGSNWLTCMKLADCAVAEDAATCSNDGFCEDSAGERIAAQAAGAGAGAGGSARAGSGEPVSVAGSDAPSRACVWSADELLADLGVEPRARKNCGQYRWWDFSSISLALECFEDAKDAGEAVEISIVNCGDCEGVNAVRAPEVPTTYIALPDGERFAITLQNDRFAAAGALSEALLQACSEISYDDSAGPPVVSCAEPQELYSCSEARDPIREPDPPPLVMPFKLGDVSSPGSIASETLHLYVSNQSFDVPLLNIDVMIDDASVVHGDVAVEGQHTWHEFAILVPAGAHIVHVSSSDRSAFLDQAIDIPAERWAVINYWNDGPPASEMFLLTVHDQPVAFE